MRSALAILPLLAATASAAVAIGSDPTNNNTPNLRLRRHLAEVVGTTEISNSYCGRCKWKGSNIVCESRAQYLVREHNYDSLVAARESILDDCADDGSDKVTVSLDAWCGDCPWLQMNFNCDARKDFLVSQYFLGEEQAKEETLLKGECIDPDYTIEEEESSSSLSNGAIVGIIILVLAILLCLLWLFAARYYRRPLCFCLPGGTTKTKDDKTKSKKEEWEEVNDIGGAVAPLDSKNVRPEQAQAAPAYVSVIDGSTIGDPSVVPVAAAPSAKKKKKKRSVAFKENIRNRPDAPGDTNYIDEYAEPTHEPPKLGSSTGDIAADEGAGPPLMKESPEEGGEDSSKDVGDGENVNTEKGGEAESGEAESGEAESGEPANKEEVEEVAVTDDGAESQEAADNTAKGLDP